MRNCVKAFMVLSAILVMLSLSRCSKDTDGSAPLVRLSSPTGNANYVFSDTIRVEGMVSDNEQIASIKVGLLNEAGISVLKPLYFYPGTNEYELHASLPLDDPLLETASYSLLVSASDGRNTSRTFTSLNISGPDKSFERLLAVCRPNSLNTYIYGADSTGEIENLLVLGHAATSSDISSRHRNLYVLKPEPSVMYAFTLDELLPRHSLAAGLPYPVFNDIHHDGMFNTYIAAGNGDILGLDPYGHITVKTAPNPDTIPMLVRRHGEMLLAYAVRRGGPQKFLNQYYALTGEVRASLEVNMQLAGIFPVDDDLVLLAGNNTDGACIAPCRLQGNYLEQEISLPCSSILSALQTAPQNLLLGCEQGLLMYDHSSGSVTEYFSGTSVTAMANDPLRNRLCLAAGGEEVYILDTRDMSLIATLVMPYPVQQLHIQYNK